MESFNSGTLLHALMDQDQNVLKTTAHRTTQYLATTILLLYVVSICRAGGYGINLENTEFSAEKGGSKEKSTK